MNPIRDPEGSEGEEGQGPLEERPQDEEKRKDAAQEAAAASVATDNPKEGADLQEGDKPEGAAADQENADLQEGDKPEGAAADQENADLQEGDKPEGAAADQENADLQEGDKPEGAAADQEGADLQEGDKPEGAAADQENADLQEGDKPEGAAADQEGADLQEGDKPEGAAADQEDADLQEGDKPEGAAADQENADLQEGDKPEGAAADQGDSDSPDDIGEGRDRPPLDSMPPLDNLVEPEPQANPERKAHAQAAKGKRGSGVLAWMLLFIFVGGLGAGFWYGRKEIVTIYPKAIALYELASLPVFPVGEGLDLVNMKTTRGRSDQGESLIVVTGEIENITQKQIVIPKIQASLRDDRGVVLTRRSLQVVPNYLNSEEKSAFEIKLTTVKGASNVVTIFINDDQALKEPDFEPRVK